MKKLFILLLFTAFLLPFTSNLYSMIAEPILFTWICPIESKELRGWRVYEDTNGDGIYDTKTEKDCSGHISRSPLEGFSGDTIDVGNSPELSNPCYPDFVNQPQKWIVIQKDSSTNEEIYRVEHDYEEDSTYIVLTNQPGQVGTGIRISYLQAEHPKILENILIAPNPTKGLIYISFNNEISYSLKISIGNIDGKILYNETKEIKKDNEKYEINLSNFQVGVYFIKFEAGGLICTRKVIISR